MIAIIEKDNALFFGVKVVPRASKSEIVGEFDGRLKIRLGSPPVDGAANEELIRVLAKHLKISKSQIEITGGQASKTKQIKIVDAKPVQIRNLV